MAEALLSLNRPGIALVDVQYDGDGTKPGEHARAACVFVHAWTDATAAREWTLEIADVLPYRPGRFFERELPCITQVLALAPGPLSAIVVDGYVVLDSAGSPGLGAHVYEYFGGSVPVLGIAKHSFRGSDFAEPVVRGQSKRPLFVTARGMPPASAARIVQQMHGANRIPTLCARVDHLCRGLVAPQNLQASR